MLATPLQLAQAAMVLANKGESFVPSVAQRVGDITVSAVRRPSVSIDEADWQAVVEGMIDVVHSSRGTAARIAKGLGYQIAGKTGTSQVVSIAQDAIYDEDAISQRNRNHGLFVAFAPVENPRIVVAVIAENGGGSGAASPVARKVLDAWLEEPSDV